MTREEVSQVCVEEPGRGSTCSSLLRLDRPVVHQVTAAPVPTDSEFSFFDPNDSVCREVLQNPETTVPELFAVLRQWVPQVQKNIDLIGTEILKRGCGVNDRDGLTDMSLLHYCCKAGAPGIGDAPRAASFARQLLLLGAETSLRSRWTNMMALHYASYFDVPLLIRVVLEAAQPGEVDSTCSDFDFGTALHIAASNLCLSAVRCLLELGANPAFRNEKGQCPADVVPEPVGALVLDMTDAESQVQEVRTLLREALPRPSCGPLPLLPSCAARPLTEKARAQLSSMGLVMGDLVVVAGQKMGMLRYCGGAEFAGGLWAGIELQDAEGKNDGSVAGVQYFSCPKRHGIFAPLSKIIKASERPRASPDPSCAAVRPHQGKVHIATRTSTVALSRSSSSSSSSLDLRHGPALRSRSLPWQRALPRARQESKTFGWRGSRTPTHHKTHQTTSVTLRKGSCDAEDFHQGERVLVVGQRTGVVRFCGQTRFAPGQWLGIELDKPNGKNDGSVGGVRYFRCPPKHGVFAPPSRVQRIHGSVDCLSSLSTTGPGHLTADPGIRRSLSTSTGISPSLGPTHKHALSRSRNTSVRRRWSATTSSSGCGVETAGRHGDGASTPPTSDKLMKLHVGMQVLLSSAREMATVRYLGTTSFAPGLWLGLELRHPHGKNDGSVDGHRYFSCRPGHGVLVRPSRVTYRGISGAKLVDGAG